MQLSKEEYARKRIHNGSVQTENSRDGIFNQPLKILITLHPTPICFNCMQSVADRDF